MPEWGKRVGGCFACLGLSKSPDISLPHIYVYCQKRCGESEKCRNLDEECFPGLQATQFHLNDVFLPSPLCRLATTFLGTLCKGGGATTHTMGVAQFRVLKRRLFWLLVDPAWPRGSSEVGRIIAHLCFWKCALPAHAHLGGEQDSGCMHAHELVPVLCCSGDVAHMCFYASSCKSMCTCGMLAHAQCQRPGMANAIMRGSAASGLYVVVLCRYTSSLCMR
jgi:hypothetical protein